MANLRVLMFGWELPPENSGGLGVACLGLSKKLNEKGVNLTFVVPRKKKSMEKDFFRLVSAGVNYKEIEVNSLLSPYLNVGSYRTILTEENDIYGKNLFEEVNRYRKCGAKIGFFEKFDVIHAHDWLSFGAGIEAKRVSGKPLVAHIHATEFDRGGGNADPRVYAKEKEGMQIADKVLAVSNYTKNIIIEKYQISPDKIAVAYNGIDYLERDSTETLTSFKSAGYQIVLFVGRITLQKGPDYFLRAAKMVVDYNDKVIFLVAGSGDMEYQVIQQAAELGISEKVIFTGFVRGEELASLYKAADLFVMPSVSEPFGLTPLESMINGTPVLVSKQSGVSEVINHALKTDFWDIEDMANKILTTLANKSLVHCLKDGAKDEVKKITWNFAAEKCIEIYQSLI